MILAGHHAPQSLDLRDWFAASYAILAEKVGGVETLDARLREWWLDNTEEGQAVKQAEWGTSPEAQQALQQVTSMFGG